MKHSLAHYITIALISFAISFSHAEPAWRNPEAKFSATDRHTDAKVITWRYTNNVQKDCEAESQKRKLGGFGYAVDACSFWDKNTCTIITARQTTMHILGHELRHCFQGGFH